MRHVAITVNTNGVCIGLRAFQFQRSVTESSKQKLKKAIADGFTALTKLVEYIQLRRALVLIAIKYNSAIINHLTTALMNEFGSVPDSREYRRQSVGERLSCCRHQRDKRKHLKTTDHEPWSVVLSALVCRADGKVSIGMVRHDSAPPKIRLTLHHYNAIKIWRPTELFFKVSNKIFR